MGFGSLSPLSLIVNEVLGSYRVFFFYEFVSDLVFLVDRMLQDLSDGLHYWGCYSTQDLGHGIEYHWDRFD